MILKPTREQEELEERFFKFGLDKDGQDLVDLEGETSATKIEKFKNYSKNVPFSATYKILSDQFGNRMSVEERIDKKDKEYENKIKDFMFMDKMKQYEEAGKFEEAYQLQKLYMKEKGFVVERSRYL